MCLLGLLLIFVDEKVAQIFGRAMVVRLWILRMDQ